jgi:hypothetical protein
VTSSRVFPLSPFSVIFQIYNPDFKWIVQCRIPGASGFQLRKLVFSTTPSEAGRLFGISFRGLIFEVSGFRCNSLSDLSFSISV